MKDVAKAILLVSRFGPSLGYFPEPEKSYVVVPEADEAAAKTAMADDGLTMRYTRGHRYVGGFVGSAASEEAWIKPQVDTWVSAVHALAKAAVRHPATA